MKWIPLTRGYATLVDDADYERVIAAGPWHTHIQPKRDTVYARRTLARNAEGKQPTQPLHRFILGVTDSKTKVDHRNRYGLDNRRNNLRITTNSQNGANANKSRRRSSSRFKGVSWHKRIGKWSAHIGIKYKLIHLGYFAEELDAARAYDAAARKHFGDFAKCNLSTKKGISL
jgi:hypothetical protein